MIPMKTYENYLHRLKDKLYKALRLYEESSETLDKNLYALVYMEIAGLERWLETSNLPHEYWYVETLTKMTSLHDIYLRGTHSHDLFKSIIFGSMNLIDKQLQQMKGE